MPAHTRFRSLGAECIADAGDNGAAVVIADRAQPLAVADRGAVGRVRQVDREGLVPLRFGVAVDHDRDRLGVLVGRELQRVGVRGVIAVGGRGGAVGGRIGDVERRRPAAARDREGQGLSAVVSLGDRDIVDRDRACDRYRIRQVAEIYGAVGELDSSMLLMTSVRSADLVP